jgi:hypothetical protein
LAIAQFTDQPGCQDGAKSYNTKDADRKHAKQPGIWAALDGIAIPYRPAKCLHSLCLDVSQVSGYSQANDGENWNGELLPPFFSSIDLLFRPTQENES